MQWKISSRRWARRAMKSPKSFEAWASREGAVAPATARLRSRSVDGFPKQETGDSRSKAVGAYGYRATYGDCQVMDPYITPAMNEFAKRFDSGEFQDLVGTPIFF